MTLSCEWIAADSASTLWRERETQRVKENLFVLGYCTLARFCESGRCLSRWHELKALSKKIIFYCCIAVSPEVLHAKLTNGKKGRVELNIDMFYQNQITMLLQRWGCSLKSRYWEKYILCTFCSRHFFRKDLLKHAYICMKISLSWCHKRHQHFHRLCDYSTLPGCWLRPLMEPHFGPSAKHVGSPFHQRAVNTGLIMRHLDG